MSSLIFAERPKEAPAPARADLGVRITAVEARIRSISLAKGKRDLQTSASSQFDFDVEMIETDRTADSMTVRYAFSVGKSSSGQVCKVGGDAVVWFSQVNSGGDFQSLGNEMTNEIAVEIFRRNYESTYLLHETLGMDAPSPWITHEVSLSSRTLA